MKKLLIFLISCTLFIACKNDKGGKKADYRDKDDYSTSDDKLSDDDSKKKDDDKSDFASDGGNWSASDNRKFVDECLAGFGDQQAIGKQVCACALDKFQKKYDSYAEVQAKSNSEEGSKIGKECAENLNIQTPATNTNTTNNNQDHYSNGGWSSAEVKGFVGPCVSEAVRGGMQELDAQSYCDCMQDKLSKLYPNARDAGNLTKEDFSTPSMQRMVKGCLPRN